MEIGRVCLKIAGRDAGKICIVIDVIDDNYVMIDGEARRRKCNINHLELLDKVVKISKNAKNSEVVAALKDLGVEVKEKKEKEKKTQTQRPKKQKAKKANVETKKLEKTRTQAKAVQQNKQEQKKTEKATEKLAKHS